MGPSPSPLPKVVVSSVVRSAHKGESHGGVYLVDFEAETIKQMLDWNDPSISWEGRGRDRGLRGIAFHEDSLLLAASDEIFVYDRDFQLRGSFGNPYLKHVHEVFVAGDRLYVTSTGFDSVLEYDLRRRSFLRGYCLRFPKAWGHRIRRRLNVRPRPAFRAYDPNQGGGPPPADTSHINNVFHQDGTLYVCGTRLGNVWAIGRGRLRRYARIPYGSHNARPFRDGVLLNHTRTDRIAFVDRGGRLQKSFPLATYDPEELLHAELPGDVARQAFGRGLAIVSDDLIVGGSSPATVTLYQFDPPKVVKSLNISMDVRNAVHGLEVWPFD